MNKEEQKRELERGIRFIKQIKKVKEDLKEAEEKTKLIDFNFLLSYCLQT